MAQIPGAIAGWLKTSAPVDVVMMLMGTNDVWRGRNVATSMANFDKSLDAMKAAKVKQLVVCPPDSSFLCLFLFTANANPTASLRLQRSPLSSPAA
jgi:hypothetical protein